MVTGTSTTVEYALGSFYETLIGQVSAALASGQLTGEVEGAEPAKDLTAVVLDRPPCAGRPRPRCYSLSRSLPGTESSAVRMWCQVRDLSTLLRSAAASGFTIEHVFDY